MPNVLRSYLWEMFRKTRIVDMTPQRADDHEPRRGSAEKASGHASSELEDQIEDLRSLPEFVDIDSFMNLKLEDDDLTFSFVELQALARNAASQRLGHKVDVAGQGDIKSIRSVLEKDMGFRLIVREPVRNIRGATSNPNGTHPFAGSGGGGSGFSSSRDGGGGFTSFGGGPGAIGSGTAWDPNDSKNLRMGARKR